MSAQSNPFPPVPSLLYHGTNLSALDAILANGIKPRGRDGRRNNWKHTVGSNASCVYLSNCYAFYFAYSSTKDGEPLVVLEVATRSLLPALCADEDALEQSGRGRDRLPSDWSMKRRTIYYRKRAHLYDPAGSIALLGTCGHIGTVPASAITRVAIIAPQDGIRLILQAHDPSITIINHSFMGEQHARFHRWLFGDEEHLYGPTESGREPSREGISVRVLNQGVKR